MFHNDGLAQDCSDSITNGLELLQTCIKPSIYSIWYMPYIQWQKKYELITLIR